MWRHAFCPALTPSRDGDGFCDRFGTACFATGAFGFAAAASLTSSIVAGPPPRRRCSKLTMSAVVDMPHAAASRADSGAISGAISGDSDAADSPLAAHRFAPVWFRFGGAAGSRAPERVDA